MKHIKLFFLSVLIFSSYGTTFAGGFWGDLVNLVNYGVSQWEQYVPANSYDHTYIDAWKSGTGGKALVVGEMAVGLVGEITKSDVSGLKKSIHNATENLNKNEIFQSNDVNNWVGALFTFGDELIDEYNKQSFEEAKREIQQDEEQSLRVERFDDENRKIIWKSNSEYMRDLINYRKSKNDNWISDNINSISNMNLDEYNNLSKEERQEIDIKILAYENQKDSLANIPPIVNEEPIDEIVVPDYKSEIERIVISDFDINSYKLSEEQQKTLDNVANLLKEDETILLIINGHTCSLGSEKINYKVGLKRALEAKEYLISVGIDPSRIDIESKGFSFPIADNSIEEGRKHNRRITFNLK